MKSYAYNIIAWLLFLLCSTLSTLAQHQYSEIVTAYIIHILDSKTAQTEGLAGSTLVKGADSYIPIASIQNNDMIAGLTAQSTQLVILNQSVPVSYIFEIQLTASRPGELQLATPQANENQTIFAAPQQQFYDTVLHSWICAQDLTTNNWIGDLRVISNRKIQKITYVHQLTTQDHLFKITQDEIIVHNANIATNALPLLFGACSCVHPVVAVIGRTISLAKLAVSMYEMYQDAQCQANALLFAMQEEEVVRTTRSYYETRRKELLTLLEQYRSLKQSIIALSGQSTSINFLFATVPAALVSQSLLPSLESELTYSCSEKQKLLQLREQELLSIEAEIATLQITLMLHLQDYGDRFTTALAELDPAYNAVQQNLKIQIPYHNKTAASNVVAQTYAGLLTLLEAIENLEQKIITLQRLIQYYQNPTNALLLKNSTNITAICSQYQTTLNQIPKFLPNLKKYAITSQQLAYQTQTQSGLLNQQTIVSIQRNLHTHRKEVEQCHNANSKIKQAQITHAIPPNDPDPEDDNDYDPNDPDDFYQPNKNPQKVNFIENNARHIFENRDGHVVDTIRNRRILQKLVRNKKNKISINPDSRGNFWYEYTLPNGKQWWAKVREKNGISFIENAGLNTVAKPFDPETGLSRNINQNPLKRS